MRVVGFVVCDSCAMGMWDVGVMGCDSCAMGMWELWGCSCAMGRWDMGVAGCDMNVGLHQYMHGDK